VMRVIDREQAKLIAGFRSTTRANARLLALTQAGVLTKFFVGTIVGGRKAIYSLSPKGAYIGGIPYRAFPRRHTGFVSRDLFFEHQFLINSIYTPLKYRPAPDPAVHFRGWRNFQEPISRTTALIPDGYFELDTRDGIRPMFLEVDLGTETIRIWRKKIEGYLRFAISGDFIALFQHSQFRVLVVTTSERRLNQIRSAVARSTAKIFWFSTFQFINRDGFWSPIWWRPQGNQKHTLL